MGVSGHCRTSQAGTLASSTETAGAAFPCSQAFTRHPCLTMRTPTTSQLRTAIEVLKNLGERINENAAHSVIQLPESRFGDQHAARIAVHAIEQTTQIETVMAQLKSWRDELKQERRQCVTQHV